MEFFRHCPQCGRRFHVKLVDKELVGSERSQTKTTEAQLLSGSPGYGGRMGVTVYEGKPLVVDVSEFQYSYRCGHCGHKWTEEHIETHREP